MKNDFATKTDIQNAIDKSEKKLRDEIILVKTELNTKIDSVRVDVSHVAAEVVRLSTDLNDFKHETRQNHNTVMNAIDGLARMITDNQVEKAAVSGIRA